MADKVAEQKPVESTVEEVEKVEKTKTVEEVPAEKEDAKVENGDSNAENGDSKDKDDSKKEEASEKNGDEAEAVADKCCVKRKSGGGEAKSATPVEGATPEKKAKLDETAEAEVAA